MLTPTEKNEMMGLLINHGVPQEKVEELMNALEDRGFIFSKRLFLHEAQSPLPELGDGC